MVDRKTKKKARRRWRALIVDGHGSHLTMEFLALCLEKRILLIVFPPHSTHTLQPLDVVLYGPLPGDYHQKLITYLHNSKGLLTVKKGDFFPLFWSAWLSSFTTKNILSSFESTGIIPFNPEVVLKKFTPSTTKQYESSNQEEIGEGSSWRQIRSVLDTVVEDPGSKVAKSLGTTFHQLQVSHALDQHKILGLENALKVKKKQKNKSSTMVLQQRGEYHSSAMFWSPRKIREAQFRETTKQQLEDEKRLQKAQRKEMRASAALYKKQMAAEAKVAREAAKVMREREKKAKQERLAESRAQKQQAAEASEAQKALNLSKKGPRVVKPKTKSRSKKVGGALEVQGGAGGGEALVPGLQNASKTRTIKRLNRYSE